MKTIRISLIPKLLRRKWALGVLRESLQKKISYYTETYSPDSSSEIYRLGMEIWIPLEDFCSSELTDKDRESMAHTAEEIRTISEEIASRFNLTAIGRGPAPGENATMFVYCGFRR